MQKKMTDRTPGSYDDFVAYLGTVRTEEELFSRLTYWFAGQNRPEDVLSRSELVEARAKELGFWQGLTFRMERWLTDGRSELEAVGREEFQSRIAEDYAADRERPTRPGRASGIAAAPRPSASPPTASRTSPSRT